MAPESNFPDFLLSPRGWAGVLAQLGFGLTGNIVASIIGLVAGISIWQLGLWVLSVAILIWGIYRVRRRAEPLVLVPGDKQPAKHRGLILLVGTGRPGEDPMDQSAKTAIEYHLSAKPGVGLERCWLIASTGQTGSLPVAQKLEEICQSLHVTARTSAVDAFSVQATYDLVQQIYKKEVPEAGLTETEVIADFTGGTKPMSAGLILACADRRPMQYMFGRKKGLVSTPTLVDFTPQSRRKT